MSPDVLRRFIKYMVILILCAGLVTLATQWLDSQEPGDYHVREGDIRLSDGRYDQALESFDKALDEMPDHRGALMGRALVFIRTQKYPEAIAELDHLINFQEKNLADEDATGRGVLAAAYANRGIVHDRQGAYQKALDDYVQSLRTDEKSVEGPGTIHKILYGTERVSTVRDRAKYIYEQLQLPEDQRLMRVPEIDAEQRMHKP